MTVLGSAYGAVLFDLDGVLTPTAELHEQAWSALFSPFLAEHGAAPYCRQDYFAHIDGRPRFEAVALLLADRGIVLPQGTPEDLAEMSTVCGLGNRKNALFQAFLAEGIVPYPGSLAFIEQLERFDTPRAIVSSSRNARPVLTAAGLAKRFGLVVDELVAAAERLQGKPAPDTYRFAARRLGCDPGECVVVEDALSGVTAGARGGFGLVVGVDRGVGADALRAAGAQVVVRELDELRAAPAGQGRVTIHVE